jgi:hypothetical protein
MTFDHRLWIILEERDSGPFLDSILKEYDSCSVNRNRDHSNMKQQTAIFVLQLSWWWSFLGLSATSGVFIDVMMMMMMMMMMTEMVLEKSVQYRYLTLLTARQDFIGTVIFSVQLWNSSLCSFLHYHNVILLANGICYPLALHANFYAVF